MVPANDGITQLPSPMPVLRRVAQQAPASRPTALCPLRALEIVTHPAVLLDLCRIRHISSSCFARSLPTDPMARRRSSGEREALAPREDKPLAWLSGEIKTPPLSS
jgi:hypothetical protein